MENKDVSFTNINFKDKYLDYIYNNRFKTIYSDEPKVFYNGEGSNEAFKKLTFLTIKNHKIKNVYLYKDGLIESIKNDEN
jgi:hypothetical protein